MSSVVVPTSDRGLQVNLRASGPLSVVAAVLTSACPPRWRLHLLLWSLICEDLGRDSQPDVAPLTLWSIILVLKLWTTLLGLSHEREAGYQLIRKAFGLLCFSSWHLRWNFLFPFELAPCHTKPPWGGWYNPMAFGCEVSEANTKQKLHGVAATCLVQRLGFVWSLSHFWVITWWSFGVWGVFFVFASRIPLWQKKCKSRSERD